MTRKKALSLCMITKNDEKNLSNCLKALEGVVDEIIVVDIGSSDETIEIAKQAGANVYQIEWKNNYSEAKNVCLDQAKGRWILFLQANETISSGQLNEMNSLLDNPNAEGYLLYINHCSEEYRISSPVQSLYLFRNRKEYRYQYKAFERIPDELLSNIKNADIQIVQQDDPSPAWEIHSRTLLLEEDLIEHPEDSYLQYMYGIELLNQQRYEESIIYFQKALQDVNLGYLFAPHLYKCLSWSFSYLQRYTDALGVLENGIKAFPFYTDLFVLRGEVYKQFRKYGEAIQDLKRCLKISEQPNSMVPGTEIDISVILETLGDIHKQAFNYQQALTCYQQAYERNKTDYKLLYKIGELVKKVDSTGVLENLVKEAIEQNNLGQMLTLMDVLFQQREYIQILGHIEYLESLLGKGEQTESIKYSCYMMLGKGEEAELHFSAINKEGPFYSHILLQRIESYWVHDQWSEAGQLLKEMQQIESINQPIKALYKLVHRLFTGKEVCFVVLTQQEYEVVSTLHENFLRVEQEGKAKMLLPLLLKEQKDDHLINLAEPWAERNNFQMIQIIFQRISDKEKQVEFKQKILDQLLRNEHIETAQKLMELGDSQPLGALEYVLWSKSFMKKLNEWKDKVHRGTTGVDADVTSTPQTPNKPDKALLDFYRSLGITKKNVNDSTLELSDTEMTCDEIHEGIGHFYEKAQKKRESLSAYLRALQWNPHNEPVQEKIKNFSRDNPTQFYTFLEEKKWTLEGSLFHHKQEFFYYILGLIHFKNKQFDQALELFSKIAEDDASYPLALAYISSSLWLMEREADADSCLDKQSKAIEVFSSIFRICKHYVLCKLGEGHQKYPYSELIIGEKEVIRNSNSNLK
jgi:tetratricopeptide (TPR) repeat protein